MVYAIELAEEEEQNIQNNIEKKLKAVETIQDRQQRENYREGLLNAAKVVGAIASATVATIATGGMAAIPVVIGSSATITDIIDNKRSFQPSPENEKSLDHLFNQIDKFRQEKAKVFDLKLKDIYEEQILIGKLKKSKVQVGSLKISIDCLKLAFSQLGKVKFGLSQLQKFYRDNQKNLDSALAILGRTRKDIVNLEEDLKDFEDYQLEIDEMKKDDYTISDDDSGEDPEDELFMLKEEIIESLEQSYKFMDQSIFHWLIIGKVKGRLNGQFF